jgi:hypothetical protein
MTSTPTDPQEPEDSGEGHPHTPQPSEGSNDAPDGTAQNPTYEQRPTYEEQQNPYGQPQSYSEHVNGQQRTYGQDETGYGQSQDRTYGQGPGGHPGYGQQDNRTYGQDNRSYGQNDRGPKLPATDSRTRLGRRTEPGSARVAGRGRSPGISRPAPDNSRLLTASTRRLRHPDPASTGLMEGTASTVASLTASTVPTRVPKRLRGCRRMQDGGGARPRGSSTTPWSRRSSARSGA